MQKFVIERVEKQYYRAVIEAETEEEALDKSYEFDYDEFRDMQDMDTETFVRGVADEGDLDFLPELIKEKE